jgi:hypothetical protein
LTDQQQPPKAPKGLLKDARQFWLGVTGALSLDVRDLALLALAVGFLDRWHRLDRLIKQTGLAGPDGRPNPLLKEQRETAQSFARTCAALRLPPDLSDVQARPQRRGPRGSYYPRLVREEKVV